MSDTLSSTHRLGAQGIEDQTAELAHVIYIVDQETNSNRDIVEQGTNSNIQLIGQFF